MARVLAGLPPELHAGIVVVQHVDKVFAPGLASWLARETSRDVRIIRAQRSAGSRSRSARVNERSPFAGAQSGLHLFGRASQLSLSPFCGRLLSDRSEPGGPGTAVGVLGSPAWAQTAPARPAGHASAPAGTRSRRIRPAAPSTACPRPRRSSMPPRKFCRSIGSPRPWPKRFRHTAGFASRKSASKRVKDDRCTVRLRRGGPRRAGCPPRSVAPAGCEYFWSTTSP